MVPGPHSRATRSVEPSIQVASCLPRGREKPWSTNRADLRSNSRTWEASSPPSDSVTRQIRSSGFRQAAPRQTQVLPSALERASRSSTVSHLGVAVR